MVAGGLVMNCAINRSALGVDTGIFSRIFFINSIKTVAYAFFFFASKQQYLPVTGGTDSSASCFYLRGA